METDTTDTAAMYPSLRAWRTAKGWNQFQAAEYLGFSQPRYSQLERGLPPNKFQAVYLNVKTGVPVEALVGANR